LAETRRIFGSFPGDEAVLAANARGIANARQWSMKSLRGLLTILGASMLGCGSQAQVPVDGPVPTEVAPAKDRVRSASQSCALRPDRDVRLARDVEPILMSRCSGEFCHGLTMTSSSRAYAFLVNQPSVECDDSRSLVMPGDLDHSYLVDKMLGRNLCAGHPMPRGLGNGLSADEVRAVTDWICEGAPND
jgi:hypothetical protein